MRNIGSKFLRRGGRPRRHDDPGGAGASGAAAASVRRSDITTTIRGEPGAPPHYAVPDFIALTNDKETADAAKLIAEVLWDDLAFEREFDMIPRDTYRTIEQTPTTDTIAFDRWRELGADGVIKGSVGAHRQHIPGRDALVQRARARRRARPRLRQRRAQKPARGLAHDVG